MKNLPAIGTLIIVLLAISGYVASSPKERTQTARAASTQQHPDAHVSYYEEHLIAMGIKRRDP